MRLTDRVIVVIGGAGLLGTRFCIGIAQEGAIAVVADVDITAAAAVADGITRCGGRAAALELNITNGAEVDRALEELHARFGAVHGVVNTAYPRNPHYGRRFEDVTYGDFCDNVGLHLGGYFVVTQRAALYFRRQGGGTIVNMGSIYGAVPPRFEIYAGTSMTMPVEYAAIKAGVLHLTRYVAQYFKRDGVRCNSLSPGGIVDQQPEAFITRYRALTGGKGLLDPDDVVGALVFLLSDDARYITGQDLVVDDGFAL